MTTFEGIHEASTAIRRWLILNESSLPEHLKERLTRLADEPSPVVVAVDFCEAVYANPEEFDADAKGIAAGAAAVCEAFGFHGMNQDNRGSRMARVLDGEKVAKDRIPEPKSDMVPPAPEPETPEPGE